MRTYPAVFILVAVILACGLAPTASAQSPSANPFEAAGTDAARVRAFLSTLQQALAVENHLKVASLMKYPLEAWADGQTVTIRSDSDLLVQYRRVFTASLRRSIAEADVAALTADASGVALDGGRLCFKADQKGRGLKIVKIGEPAAIR